MSVETDIRERYVGMLKHMLAMFTEGELVEMLAQAIREIRQHDEDDKQSG